jgi:heme-degrading monooxygenase HmoA
MHARVVTFTAVTDIDAGIGVIRENVLPVLRDQKGFRSLHASADRSQAVLAVLTIWDTESEREASWDAVAPMRGENMAAIGGDVSVDRYEVLVQEIGGIPPVPGSALLLQPADTDTAKVGELLASFRSEVLPQIRTSPGFRAVRLLMNRETGRGMIATAWSDEAAMSEAAAETRSRWQASAARGVLLGEPSSREIVLTDIG